MYFLWLFGAAVEEKLRHPRFLLFYLTAGVLAGIGLVLLYLAQ
jgi:membrane associated rhomboid family serine protease